MERWHTRLSTSPILSTRLPGALSGSRGNRADMVLRLSALHGGGKSGTKKGGQGEAMGQGLFLVSLQSSDHLLMQRRCAQLTGWGADLVLGFSHPETEN